MNQPFFSVCRLAAGIPRLGLRSKHTKVSEQDLTGFERIWIFNHIQNNHVVYSTKPVMDNSKAMAQIPFNGKKLKPEALRKDYWRPMAVVEFARGHGLVGLSVFQKLREFRMMHELAWEEPELIRLSRRARGEALNDQKANSVADLAAVLAGGGKGNLMWVREKRDDGSKDRPSEERGRERARDADATAAARRLHEVTVFWADAKDREFAREWSPNVFHRLGLPPQTTRTQEEAPEVERPGSREDAGAREAPLV